MFFGENFQFGHPRHSAVVVHDLADHGSGRESGDTCDVDARLCLPDAHEDSSVFRPEWKHVARTCEI